MNTFTFTTIPLLAALVVGCGTVHHEVKVQYAPKKEGPLASVRAKSVLVQVLDQRPADETNCVSKWENASYGPDQVYTTKDSPPDIVYNALKQEFEFNGHKVVGDTTAKPDATVTVRLKRFYGVLSGAGKVAQIDAEVSVQRTAVNTIASPAPVSGTFKTTYSSTGVRMPDPSKELSGALSELIRNMTLDSRFLEALQ